MGGWNQWMEGERAEAPLDELTAYVKKKWEETKEWLHDLCIEDGKMTSNTRHRNADGKLATAELNAGTTNKPVCVSGYEELEQRGSMESSAPWAIDSNAPQSPENSASTPPMTPPMTATLPPSGIPYQVPVEVEIMPPQHVSLQKKDSMNSSVEADKKFCSSDGITPRSQFKHREEIKSEAAIMTQQRGSGPSVVGVHHEVRPLWQQGEKVEVWSMSMQCWFEGMILQSCAVDSVVDGHKIPSGSYQVVYSGDTVKWIWPDQVQDLMRPLSRMSGI